MAIFQNTDATVTINSVDVSDHVVSCEWVETFDTTESVAMGGTNYVKVLPTFKRGTFNVELQQDFAASDVYATLVAVFDADPAVAVNVTYKHTSAPTSETNPEMQTAAILTSMPIIAGAIAEIATITASFVFDGNGVTRADGT